MINSSLPVNVLDLKKSNALANAKDAANKKATKGKGFGDELVEKQKKLKNKDEDLGPVQQSKSDRQDKKVSQDDKQQPSSNDKSKTVGVESKSMDKTKVAAPVANAPVNGEVTDEAAAQAEQAAPNLEMLQVLEGETPLSDINSADFAKNLSGKMSLEGFQMVEPKALAPEALETSPADSALAALKSLAATAEGITAKGDANSKDLSSKQEGGEAAQLNVADLLATAPAGIKENPQTSFANALKAQAADALVTDSVRQSNVDNLVSSARTILKDGGGQMQVVLTPDGLGTVDLKIGVEKGVVSVEINTQDKHVKKLFDDSIMDIRHALEGQNLKVDTLKVGISENFDAQQQMSQGQMDMMEREFAREFMGQFRDERQGFRTANITDKLSGPGSQPNKPEGLNPAARPGVANGRLNVVA